MINRVVLVGRMTRDPELRRTPQGDAVTSFTLAVNRNYTSRDGQQQADFINCVVWRKPAENVERYCSKGSLVGVEGRIQTRRDVYKRQVQEIAKKLNIVVNGVIRITPGVYAGGHDYIRVGAKDTKFGFSSHDNTYLKAIKKVIDCLLYTSRCV